MTLKETVEQAISAGVNRWKGKEKEKDSTAAAATTGPNDVTAVQPPSDDDDDKAQRRLAGVDTSKPSIPDANLPRDSTVLPADSVKPGAAAIIPSQHLKISAAPAPTSAESHDTATAADIVRGEAPSTAAATMSRTPSSASMRIAQYKEKLRRSIPAGQFDIENATGLPLNISLNQVGPLYYDIVKPGEVFSRQTGKVWFTIEIRLHLGPASEYSKWSVAWPIMLMAGPSAAALSLAAIPLVVLFTGTASITALVATAVEGVTAAFSSVATALGVANRLPFASKYRNKAVGALKNQAVQSQAFAAEVFNTINEKGGLRGYLDHLKSRGGEPSPAAAIELPENPTSVHDITGADLAEVLDVEGAGPKGWKKRRWNALREDLKRVKIVDRGWYAGKEPNLRVTGGPRIVTVDNPFPRNDTERRTILEIYPLRLEKVLESAVGGEADGIAFEEVAKGEPTVEGDAEGSRPDTKAVVEKAAEVLRE